MSTVPIDETALWEGRFQSCLTQEESNVLSCDRYIELNPVRASVVSHPAEYRWSSYRTNAQPEASSLVQPYPQYEVLGCDIQTRQYACRELFRHHLDPGFVDDIRAATNGNYALGSSRFKTKVSAALGRCVMPEKPWAFRIVPTDYPGYSINCAGQAPIWANLACGKRILGKTVKQAVQL